MMKLLHMQYEGFLKKIHKTLIYISSKVLSKVFAPELLPELLKIAKVTSVFKNRGTAYLADQRPMLAFPCFSKILEKLIYNKLYIQSTENKMLFSKNFGFRADHSITHANIGLVIKNAFIENKYTVRVFNDLSEAFETVNKKVLIEKPKMYFV